LQADVSQEQSASSEGSVPDNNSVGSADECLLNVEQALSNDEHSFSSDSRKSNEEVPYRFVVPVHKEWLPPLAWTFPLNPIACVTVPTRSLGVRRSVVDKASLPPLLVATATPSLVTSPAPDMPSFLSTHTRRVIIPTPRTFPTAFDQFLQQQLKMVQQN
jgi:hypothetical protein